MAAGRARNSAEQAIITPVVKGTRAMYVIQLYFTRKIVAYATTVSSGLSDFMACTSETGICEVAEFEKMCPTIWKAAIGAVHLITNASGPAKPCVETLPFGNERAKDGDFEAELMRALEKKAAKTNWIMVRLTGYTYICRIDFDKLLETALERYQSKQRTTSLILTGGAATRTASWVSSKNDSARLRRLTRSIDDLLSLRLCQR